MDFIKNAVSNATKGEGQGQKTDAPAQGGNANAQASGSSSSGQMDYVDKAFDAISKKAGHDFDRETDEKITDAARNAYEKYSGKPVSDKISN